MCSNNNHDEIQHIFETLSTLRNIIEERFLTLENEMNRFQDEYFYTTTLNTIKADILSDLDLQLIYINPNISDEKILNAMING